MMEAPLLDLCYEKASSRPDDGIRATGALMICQILKSTSVIIFKAFRLGSGLRFTNHFGAALFSPTLRACPAQMSQKTAIAKQREVRSLILCASQRHLRKGSLHLGNSRFAIRTCIPVSPLMTYFAPAAFAAF